MRKILSWLLAALVGAGILVTPAVATAAPGDVGYVGPAYSGLSTPPTADKPQSKLWWHSNQWWAHMWGGSSWTIHSLDRATNTWKNTGVVVETRKNTSADTLFDGSKLFIATHVVKGSSAASASGQPARLYRFSFSGGKWVKDSGFPKNINNYSSESLTIDKTSSGSVWATWTQVTGTGASATSAVYVNNGTGSGATWGSPFVVPTTGGVNPRPKADDISALVTYGNYVGVLWSNQIDSRVYWSLHSDSAGRTSWNGRTALSGTRAADDHINIKSIVADSSGRVWAVVKTSLGDSSSDPQSAAGIKLLSYQPSSQSWTNTNVSTVGDCQTRPQLMLDEPAQKLHVVVTGKTGTGTCTSTGDGAIYLKSASMGSPSFQSGNGTVIMRDAASERLNNVTTSKQTITAASGLVVLASNHSTGRYWHSDTMAGSASTPPPTGSAPASSFDASTTSGTAPLAVSFTDTSTNSPTSWAWNFGDGNTSTQRNPSHTFQAAGTYTVTLTASNAAGAGTAASRTVTVAAPPSGGGGGGGGATAVAAGASATSASTAAVGSVTLTKPASVSAGSLLVAQFTADDGPGVTAAPDGWTPVINPLSINARATVFAYYKVAGSSEPASYAWQLSTPVKWNGGITAYTGVDPANPFDSAASTASNLGTNSTTLTVPGVTTTQPGALLVGGVGMNGSSVAVTPPSGWTENWEGTNAQVAESARQSRPTAGATGNATWTFGTAGITAGWLRALRPAA
ncbi:PKD domain-containing protein [Geodermatophilus sp. YIM 151500]|uniref:PKD domain-containing protein n=1 Tax=Geodermatophilus sp. YIM 151500 TaxID=2984531 RepID=UPI0021E4B711|nr:PKD domain-containing protein [Geodermatophilus sp. YIM 151500]MCV2491114.1 PKD domain-containing protein [Geodermatophilus sp. YIM 151500]